MAYPEHSSRSPSPDLTPYDEADVPGKGKGNASFGDHQTFQDISLTEYFLPLFGYRPKEFQEFNFDPRPSEFRKVDRIIRRDTVEKFGPVRSVKPSLVFELGFISIINDSSGMLSCHAIS